MKNVLQDLPFDVWMSISSHLSIRSICNLALTCRDLSIIMNDRSLWILALRDILTVMPLKGIRETMSSMSLREIRATTVRATRVNEVFAHEEIEPVIVKRSLFGKGSTTLVELGPRGQWMLTFDNNGTLSFYRTLDHHTPLLVMHRPKCRTAYYWDFDRKYVLIRIVRGEHVVVVSEIYYAYSGEKHSRYIVYHFDVDAPRFRSLFVITKPASLCSCLTFREGFFVIGWEEGECFFLYIREFMLSEDEPDREVIMSLGTDVADPQLITSLICRHMVLVAVPQSLRLYSIPELSHVREGLTPKPITVTPAAIHDNSQSDAMDFVGSICAHHAGNRLPAVGACPGGGYEVLVLPRAGQGNAPAGSPAHSRSIVRHAISDCDFEPSRVLYNTSLDPEEFKLCVSSHYTCPDVHPGYMRLGQSIPLDPQHVSSIVLKEKGDIKDVSWDEGSGRVLVLLSTWGEDENGEIRDLGIDELLIIDLL